MEKTSFILYAEQLDQLVLLDMAQRGELLTYLMRAAAGNIPDVAELDRDPAVGTAFAFIWAQCCRDGKKYAETSAQRSAAGAAGADARWQKVAKPGKKKQAVAKPGKRSQAVAEDGKASQDMAEDGKASQSLASDGKTWQTMANDGNEWQTCQNETDSESDSLKKREREKRKETPASGLLPDLTEDQAERLNAAFDAFAQMRKKIKAPLTDDAAQLTVKKLTEYATVNGAFDVDLAIAILNQSTQRSWRGVFPLKDDNAAAAVQKPPNAFHNFEERRYDYDALMRQKREEAKARDG